MLPNHIVEEVFNDLAKLDAPDSLMLTKLMEIMERQQQENQELKTQVVELEAKIAKLTAFQETMESTQAQLMVDTCMLKVEMSRLRKGVMESLSKSSQALATSQHQAAPSLN